MSMGNHWSWRDDWAQRLGLPADSLDATVLEAWARHRWAECKGLDTSRRRLILGWILNTLSRSWGKGPHVREACRVILNLKADNPELVARFGAETEAA